MSKILTDKEIADLILRVIDEQILDPDNHKEFVNNLAIAITQSLGGCHSYPDYIGDGLGYTVAFNIDSFVPADGGVFAKYDTDVVWENGMEREQSGVDILNGIHERLVTNCASCENCRKCGTTICGNDTENLSCWEG